MSGGSWDYLCYCEPDELQRRTHDLEKMGQRLVKDGHKEIGERFFEMVELLKIWEAKKEVFMETYGDVMRGIEWTDSGDSSSYDDVVKKLTHQ